MEKGKRLYKSSTIEVTKYDDEIYIEDLTGPPLSDSCLIFPLKEFADMVKVVSKKIKD